MKNTILYSTENGNYYLYHIDLSLSMLIHPELINAYNKSKDVDHYYLKKYEYLKENGFFGEAKSVNFGNVLNESVINENIKQLPQLVFETTDHCNLNCKYCSLGDLYDFGKKERKNVNVKYALNLLKYIFGVKQKGADFAIGFFGGEPLVNASFIEVIIKEAKLLNEEKKLNLKFVITTNATLIDKYMHLLVDNNFSMLISLDGDEKGHSYRVFAKDGKSSFNQVIRNIDRLQREYPEYFANNVEFNAVLNDQNSVKEIYEFIFNRYRKIPTIAQLNLDHVNPDKKNVLEKIFSDRRKSEDEFQKEGSNLLSVVHEELIKFKELDHFLRNYSINFYTVNLLDLLYDEVNPVPTRSCSPFQRKMFFNTYDCLLPCEKVSYKYSMGKAEDEVFIDIAGIVKKYNFYYDQFKEVCQQCYARRACSVCLLTLDNLDKLGTNEFACVDFQDEKSFNDRLHRVFSFLEINSSDMLKIIDNKMIE